MHCRCGPSLKGDINCGIPRIRPHARHGSCRTKLIGWPRLFSRRQAPGVSLALRPGRRHWLGVAVVALSWRGLLVGFAVQSGETSISATAMLLGAPRGLWLGSWKGAVKGRGRSRGRSSGRLNGPFPYSVSVFGADIHDKTRRVYTTIIVGPRPSCLLVVQLQHEQHETMDFHMPRRECQILKSKPSH